MAERIYVRNGGKLEPLEEEPFSTEDALQRLLAEHPELLDGEQMRPGDPRRWILVTREQGIADAPGAAPRWSLDHLVIDQDATPTLVEVKRGANAEVRRTVIGQMLDYAAHASHVWTADELRRTFEEQPDADEQLTTLLGDEQSDADKFWDDVARNLAAERLRLLFVADAIPDELEQVVEFLNRQMPDVEVFAVELKQFRGGSTQTLVPRVIGRQAAGPGRSPSGGPRKKLTREELLETLPNDDVRKTANGLFDIAEECGGRVQGGDASLAIQAVSADGKRHTVALVYRPRPGKSFLGQKEFAFGARSTSWMAAGPVRDYLKEWARQFEADGFTELASGQQGAVWVVSYDDAVKNFDLLAGRLRTALTEIGKL